jgi:sugar/nucleoside kinase (ribokinase family)
LTNHTDAPLRRRPARFAVFGHANLEMNAAIGAFPVAYAPDQSLPDPIAVGVAGTAYNVGIGLWRLGNQVDLCITLGQDAVAAFVAASLPADERLRIIPASVPEQPVTVVLTGQATQRMVLTDHRGARSFRHRPATAALLIDTADVVVVPVGPVNRDLAEHLARRDRPRPVTVACDVHAISALTGPHEPFCAAADVLFMSDERIPLPAEDWLGQVMDRWPVRIAVLGQGQRGATLAVRGTPKMQHVAAAPAGEIASTLGAGDALCAGFLDGHTRGLPPGKHSTAQRSSLPRNSPLSAAQPGSSPLTNSVPASPRRERTRARHEPTRCPPHRATPRTARRRTTDPDDRA